jgi:hypothetical protein
MALRGGITNVLDHVIADDDIEAPVIKGQVEVVYWQRTLG